MQKTGIEIKVNYGKAVEVAKKALSMLESRVYPFNIPDLFPDETLPEGVKKGSEEHARYLLYAVALDSMRDAKVTYRKARELHKRMDFSDITNLDKSFVEWTINNYFEKPKKEGGRLMGNPVKMFVENAKRLEEFYEGDPRKIKKDTVQETLKEISKFRQYGKTNNALLLKNYVKVGIWDFPHNGFPIKIDRHVIRISLGTGVVELPNVSSPIRYDILVGPLDEVYHRVIRDENVSAIKLNDAFWAIGKHRCGENNAIYCGIDCPMSCEVKPATDKKFTTIELNKDTRRNRKNLFNL